MSPRALANQEKVAQVKRLNHWTRSILLSLATLVSLGTVGLLAADQLYRPDAFVIDELKIQGTFKYLKPEQIEDIVNQRELGNFFSIELDQIERQIETLEWVQEARVRREWPNTLQVAVSEQQPVMRWGNDAWVNTRGEVIKLPFKTKAHNTITLRGHERDARLMLDRSLTWRQELAESELLLREMTLSESHAYKLELQEADVDSAFTVQLGRRDVDSRLKRFLELYRTQLNPQQQRLITVDARYPDGVAIAAETISTSGLEPEAGTSDE